MAQKRPDLETEEPFIDGWTRLVTLFVTSGLSRPENEFAQRRNFKDVDQVKEIQASVTEEKGSWRIPNK